MRSHVVSWSMLLLARRLPCADKDLSLLVTPPPELRENTSRGVVVGTASSNLQRSIGNSADAVLVRPPLFHVFHPSDPSNSANPSDPSHLSNPSNLLSIAIFNLRYLI